MATYVVQIDKTFVIEASNAAEAMERAGQLLRDTFEQDGGEVELLKFKKIIRNKDSKKQ